MPPGEFYIITALAAIATSIILFTRLVIRYKTNKKLRKRFLRLAEFLKKPACREKETPEKTICYHFDVRPGGEELLFDFKLSPGICSNFNASLLIKKKGIKVYYL